ncbi:MAG TPA: hypothetical protein VMC84_03370 [Methanocella sp.]|uniref:hypothetical protein n=1 Tax=Methanocella sp. TaxID=2052833 RepID=UPI002CF342FC|nr:hypothetical protein [Methanocella sp.]HTY90194.1 hypothetical protein [Methanocella sp.]
MKFTRIAVVAAVVICTALQLVAPAFGWYWPIMGFSTGFAPNLAPGPHLPSPQDQMLPGTTQWGYPPIDRAQMVSPGAAYGPHPFNGTLNFGSALPFGLIKRTVSAPESAEAALTGANNTSAKGENTTVKMGNTSVKVPNNTIKGMSGVPGGLSGWLSSR